MSSFLDICYSAQSKQCLDIHLPTQSSFPVLIYFHGGGLESGDKGDDKIFFDYLTEQGIAVVSVNYRMYPNAKYPDFLIDSAEAVSWVFNNIYNYGNATEIFIGGSSAGGYISQMLCFDESLLSRHNISLSDIAGFIHDAGQPTCHFNVLREQGFDRRRVIVDETASLYHIGADRNYPPMLIIVSDNDMTNRYEQTMLLVSTLKHFNYEQKVFLKVMSGTHCAYVKAKDEDGKSVFGKIVSGFVGEKCI